MPNAHDRFFRAVFSQPENAAAHFRQYLPRELVDALDLERASLESGSLVPAAMKQREADLLYRVPLRPEVVPARAGGDGAEVYVFVLFEHQSKVDPMMPLRMLLYMTGIWERAWVERDTPVRLPAIIPIVLYHGHRRWKAARAFQDLIDLPPEILASVSGYLPSFRFLLNDLKRIEDSDLQFHPVLGLVLRGLKHSRDPDFKALLPTLGASATEAFNEGDRGLSALVLFMHYIYEQREDVLPEDFAAFVDEHARPGLKEIVMSTAERLRSEGREEGIEIGLSTMRRVLVRLIQLRFGPPTEDTERRVAEATEAELAAWAERVITATSVDEVFSA
ncbi:MAG: Rpn family recombination-promoting nuclease/putative transposase [Myxococcota bacterium]